MSKVQSYISRTVAEIEKADVELAREFEGIRREERLRAEAETIKRRFANYFSVPASALEGVETNAALETIVLRIGRPVLSIFENNTILEFKDAESSVWQDRLVAARPLLLPAIQSVGRIETKHHPDGFLWVGTGWLVAPDVVVTNRHVAALIGHQGGSGYVFRQGTGGKKVAASIDFLKEADRDEEHEFPLLEILHIGDERGPDIAFIRITPPEGKVLPAPIKLSNDLPEVKQEVVVIGYPARDRRIPEQDLVTAIFGNVYDKKRLAPGQVTKISPDELLHDCSTLGGNSGSVVLNLKTGEAAGLHFAGLFLQTNYAIPSIVISKELHQVRQKKLNIATQPLPRLMPDQAATGPYQATPQPPYPNVSDSTQKMMGFTIPLHCSISVGVPVYDQGATQPHARQAVFSDANQEDEEFFTEGVIEDYANRSGYEAGFLGREAEVPLPEVADPRRLIDVLSFENEGKTQQVLNYQHFSVVMSRTRRMCLFSAVNIDGKTSKGMPRVGWRMDPRIPKEAQIIKECYGDEKNGRFSRGHMTRREDPIWGPEQEAAQGNADSMHVTNTVPQMQTHNAGVWLGLENYALQHARLDAMRISVFTGPILLPDDPIYFGVTVPRSFWKIIAFLHDKTNELCATGYILSQEKDLPKQEFIYDQYRLKSGITIQVSIASIEQQTGLDFKVLKDRDAFRKTAEAPETALTRLSQIQFLPN